MGTVAKALELLDLFTRARPEIGLSELARLADLNKATCYRLASALCDHGLLEQPGEGRGYRLGPAFLRFAALREAHLPLRGAALPILQRLAERTGETAHLSILVGGQLRPLAHAYSAAHVTKVTMEDTESLPFHATSSGLAVLAFGPDSLRRAVLAGPLPALTAATLTDPLGLAARIDQVRQTGIAESAGGYAAEVHSMAAPLYGAAGDCIGALAVAAMASRLGAEAQGPIRDALRDAARQISTAWGAGPQPPAPSAPPAPPAPPRP